MLTILRPAVLILSEIAHVKEGIISNISAEQRCSACDEIRRQQSIPIKTTQRGQFDFIAKFVQKSLAYLAEMEATVRPEKYVKFVQLIGLYEDRLLKNRQMLDCVNDLLEGHDRLIDGFGDFWNYDFGDGELEAFKCTRCPDDCLDV